MAGHGDNHDFGGSSRNQGGGGWDYGGHREYGGGHRGYASDRGDSGDRGYDGDRRSGGERIFDRGLWPGPPICFNCDEPGHYANQCSHPRWNSHPSTSASRGGSSPPNRPNFSRCQLLDPLESKVAEIGSRAGREVWASQRRKAERKEAEERAEAERVAAVLNKKKKEEKSCKEVDIKEELHKSLDARMVVRVGKLHEDVDSAVPAEESSASSNKTEELNLQTRRLCIIEKRKRGPEAVFKGSSPMELPPKRTPKRGSRPVGFSGRPVHLRRLLRATIGIVGRLRFEKRVLSDLKNLDALVLQNICKDEGIPYNVGYDGGLVDLSFGLRSGSGQDVTHTVLVNPGSSSNHTAPSVGPCGLPDTRGRGCGQSGDERGLVSRGRTTVGTAGVRAEGTRTGGSTTAGGAVHRGGDDADGYAAEVAGREVWDDYRRQSRQSSTSAITRGVAKINVRADDTPGDCDGAGGEDLSAGDGGNDNDDDDDGEMEIRPLGKKRGGPRATSKSSEPRAGRRGKKTAGDALAGDGAKSRDFWTVEHMIALVRAKRDQDLHLAGLGHNMGRMKTKTWKWADIESRLVQIGVTTKKADDCGKKWDNLYMQFKIVHKLPARRSGDGGRARYFSGAAIGFRARWVDEGTGVRCEAEHCCWCCRGVAKDLEGGSGCHNGGARPEATSRGDGEGPATSATSTATVGGFGGGKAQPAQKGDATAIGTRTAAADRSGRTRVAEGAGEERVDDVRNDVRHDEGRRDGKREGDDDDDRPLVTRLKGDAKEDGLEERSKLWVDCDSFWGQGPGKPLREAVGECADYFIAIANGDAGAEPPAMLILPPNDIFKSSSQSAGFARPESYITVDIATNVARAVWKGQEWSNVVSPALVYHTLAMKMDVPLWFAGVKIVDRPEDDDMAVRQEATVLRIAECWTDAMWCGQWADDGRVKQERLSRLADCLRALLSACMWIMRMGGDDDRSHYEACLCSSLVAKPTMIAAASYIFNWRRHIVDSANLVLDRIGKAHLTLGEYPHCIPKWCDCGLVFGHNAALKNVAEAAKHGWIGSGPAAEEVGDEDG
ncbi:hypothetical protein CBR_g36928 [Chara braunii]|uniref:CCHC-type domain-containing protein n=1 Tax=Chara braunii TaxID=69332 RepID=A0A388JZC2_CHABU|nr:hypothetical protein CBR_g36928 [Chara braunii]|eukprot:GBG63159.1 hypothetical protein CBR_g36928 [Chara braunii]